MGSKMDKANITQQMTNAFTLVNGSKIKLCWYHCNRQGGCRQLATCSNDHNTFPDKYNGKHYTDLTEAQRSDVAKTCQRL